LFTAPVKKNPIKRRTPSCSTCKNAGIPESISIVHSHLYSQNWDLVDSILV
jgi:hypothetical protein